MRISPLDIRQQQFTVKWLRGFDVHEVDAFLDDVAEDYETVLKENLHLMRDALDKYYADAGRYPDALADLVAKRYLRSIPDDPITQSSATWVALPPTDPQKGAVFDVKSGAKGAGRDGKPYEQW